MIRDQTAGGTSSPADQQETGMPRYTNDQLDEIERLIIDSAADDESDDPAPVLTAWAEGRAQGRDGDEERAVGGGDVEALRASRRDRDTPNPASGNQAERLAAARRKNRSTP